MKVKEVSIVAGKHFEFSIMCQSPSLVKGSVSVLEFLGGFPGALLLICVD